MFKKIPALRIAIALAALAAVGVGVRMYFFPAAAPPRYVTATATKADLEDAVLASGTLQAFKQVSVGAQASGQIKRLAVALGDTVKKGQLIAEIDSLTQQNNLQNAEAALDNVRAQLAQRQAMLRQAELAYQRQQTLLAADAGSRQAFEDAEATLATTRAEIAALQAQIKQAGITADTARVNLGYTKIVAPLDGVVVATIVQEGQTVNANQTTPTIIKLAQLDTMTIKAQISEADVVRVQPGQEVYFTILGEPDQRYYATLRAVEPAPDSISTESSLSTSSSSSSSTAIYYNGLFDVPNPEGKLRISMTAQVSIVRAQARDTLTIPASALGLRDKEGRYVVRVVGPDGQAAPRKIKVGMNNNVSAQVLDGLKEGDKVVLGEAAAGAGSGAGTGTGAAPRRMGPSMRL
ncbi:efflux RND transporter periplasmic adaptor subunit [Ramlibacter sp. H39-3-26]|uniref:efflux RND transporter periplasmic adaptor subunit n=1 Tax=Curvibacter soli TaxID=3031331 RepID=UPI0023DC569C|nr:efflux RND transporter periplasmic adaptor subunit [Ramlibacter sp. H39-3-26]MDF1485846.1 efflux RND transporter periplasmic adaptor subunit [Ramlibacter sp. H39-3-26]